MWNPRDAVDALRAAVQTPMAMHGVARIRLPSLASPPSIRNLRTLLAILSRGLGHLLPQSYANNHTALIRDRGKSYANVQTRGHQTNSELRFHSDRADCNLLLYIRGAAHGGQVAIVEYAAAATVLNSLSPSSYRTLFKPFPFDLREERIFFEPRWYYRPILWQGVSGLRGHYIRRFIQDADRHDGCSPLTAAQRQALDDFDMVLQDLRPARSFLPVPGELVLLDNFRVLHARDPYIDTPGVGGRLVMRTWLAPYDSEPLPHFLLPMMGSLEAGSYRGGIGRGARYLSKIGKISPKRRPS
ncbi:MAG: TauD/TfdA family dioxygenase [Cyanobacteriota bacterium]